MDYAIQQSPYLSTDKYYLLYLHNPTKSFNVNIEGILKERNRLEVKGT